MARSNKLLLWVLIGVGAPCLLCIVGGVAVTALGLVTDTDGGGGTASASAPARTAQRGVEGGFSFEPPAGWTSPSPGRFMVEQHDDSAVRTVEVIHLASVPGLDAPEAKLARLWTQVVGASWQGTTETPLVMRRFVSNGARAHFTSADLRPKQGGNALSRVSLYLVEAEDRLEPLVIIQSYGDPNAPESGMDMFARFSWDKSHVLVEAALAGTRGSPVGLPLLADEEVMGRFVYGTNSTAQWVNSMTGSTSMTAVAYSVQFAFGDDHRVSYKFQGASGQVGALKFGTDADEGRWSVEHDLLVLTFDSGKQRKYLIAGASRTPEGKRSLYLLPEPDWSLSPGPLGRNGQLYVEE